MPFWSRRAAPRFDGTRGRPPSGNGASSSHLWWRFASGAPKRFAAVEATLTVTAPPPGPELRFWALQVDFVDGAGTSLGGAHTGLQHHPAAPRGAANWGGYAAGAGELSGTRPELPLVDSVNTVRLPWSPGVAHRFTVAKGATGWASTVTPEGGRPIVLRDLHAPGSVGLAAPVVWSEVFAPCDAPPHAVRWSDLVAIDDQGTAWRAVSVSVTHQAVTDGGCVTSDSVVVPGRPDTVEQRTGVARTTPAGAELGLR